MSIDHTEGYPNAELVPRHTAYPLTDTSFEIDLDTERAPAAAVPWTRRTCPHR